MRAQRGQHRRRVGLLGYGAVNRKVHRLLVGFGAAFSYVSGLKLVSNWFPASRFATLAGLDSDFPDTARIPFAGGIVVFGLAVRWVVGGMTVRVDDGGDVVPELVHGEVHRKL